MCSFGGGGGGVQLKRTSFVWKQNVDNWRRPLSRSTAFIQEASVHEARRPPMTNAHALLDDTETAFRQVHASEQLFACIFKRVNISWVRGQLMRSPACTDPKRSILRGQNSRRNYTGGFWSWPPATYTTIATDAPPGDQLITIVKETVKRVLIRKILKKWNLCVSLIDLRMTKTLLITIATDAPPGDQLITIVKETVKRVLIRKI